MMVHTSLYMSIHNLCDECGMPDDFFPESAVARAVASLQPDNAVSLFTLGRRNSDVTQLESILKDAPDEPNTLFTLGEIYSCMGQDEAAIRASSLKAAGYFDRFFQEIPLEKILDTAKGSDKAIAADKVRQLLSATKAYRNAEMLDKAIALEQKLYDETEFKSDPKFVLKLALLYSRAGHKNPADMAKYKAQADILLGRWRKLSQEYRFLITSPTLLSVAMHFFSYDDEAGAQGFLHNLLKRKKMSEHPYTEGSEFAILKNLSAVDLYKTENPDKELEISSSAEDIATFRKAIGKFSKEWDTKINPLVDYVVQEFKALSLEQRGLYLLGIMCEAVSKSKELSTKDERRKYREMAKKYYTLAIDKGVSQKLIDLEKVVYGVTLLTREIVLRHSS